MRQFDNLDSYSDNDGNILIGKAVFFDNSGVEAEVYDADNNSLGSTIFTDNTGKFSSQVFLGDKDYRVRFYKYVGETSMNEDVDDYYAWEYQYDVLNKYMTVKVEVDTTGGIQSISTMESLKKMNPQDIAVIDGNRVVNLLGYYSVGDKPMVTYRWDENSLLADNDGSVIKVAGISRGRWILIVGFDYLDVKHFGVFPHDGLVSDMQSKLRIDRAQAYASSVGLKLFFDGSDLACYYDVSGLSLNGISASKKSRFFANGGTNTNLTDVDSVYVYSDIDHNGTVNVSGRVLRTSFNVSNSSSVILMPTERLYMDTDYSNAVGIKDVDVFVEVNQTQNGNYDSCVFHGEGKFSGYQARRIFTNCEITQGMIESFGDNFWTFNDCKSDESKWEDIDLYIDFCIRNKSYDIDLRWRESSYNNSFTFSHDCVIRKANINCKAVFLGNVDIKENSKLVNVSFGNSICEKLAIRDSEVSFENSENKYLAMEVSIDNSTISNGILRVEKGFIKNSHVYCNLSICRDYDKVVSFRLTNNYIHAIVPEISWKTIDEAFGDSHTFVNQLYVENNEYIGTKRAVLTFDNSKFERTQGFYRVTKNTNVLGYSDSEEMYVVGTTGVRELIHEVDGIRVGDTSDLSVLGMYFEFVRSSENENGGRVILRGLQNKFFSFGETNNTVNKAYGVETSFSAVRTGKMFYRGSETSVTEEINFSAGNYIVPGESFNNLNVSAALSEYCPNMPDYDSVKGTVERAYKMYFCNGNYSIRIFSSDYLVENYVS